MPWTGRNLADREAVEQAIAELTRRDRSGTSALARPVQTGGETELAPDASRLLPTLPGLRDALPWPGGLLKGATVAAVGSTSLILALLAAAMTEGAWAAVVGMPSLGCLAADEYGVPLDRLALVPDPGPDWPTVVGALIDGVDLVVVRADADEDTIRSLRSRARERGCVLMPTVAWPGADVVIERTGMRWEGLRSGGGRLRWQWATFTVSGRGRASKAKTVELVFPPPPENPTPEQVRRAREWLLVQQEMEQIRRQPQPAQGAVPANRRPAERPQNDLWSNLRPNEPPPELRTT